MSSASNVWSPSCSKPSPSPCCWARCPVAVWLPRNRRPEDHQRHPGHQAIPSSARRRRPKRGHAAVAGTCTGTTLIKKDLTIAWLEFGGIECDAAGRCRDWASRAGDPQERQLASGHHGGPERQAPAHRAGPASPPRDRRGPDRQLEAPHDPGARAWRFNPSVAVRVAGATRLRNCAVTNTDTGPTSAASRTRSRPPPR